MSDYETSREIKIKVEILNYKPYVPDTWHNQGNKEELEYNAYFVVPTNGQDVLTNIPSEICEELDLKQEILEYIKDRRACMKGRDLYEEQQEYLDSASKVFYKIM